MTYSECIDYISGILGSIDWSDMSDSVLQFNIIGSDNGVFYIDIRDHKADIILDDQKTQITAGTYNVKIVITLPVLSRILRKVVDPLYAFTTGKYQMMGDVPAGRKVLVKMSEYAN